MKKGILIVSFGTTYRETREKNIDRLAAIVREKFPQAEVLQAYSSDKVRRILESRDGIEIPGIADALEKMHDNGITHLYVLPTHIIDGIENNRLRRVMEQKREYFKEMELASVLLGSEADDRKAAQAVLEELKPENGETVIFMGHGTSHEADESYRRLEEAFRSLTESPVYVATVEGSVTIQMVIQEMKKNDEGNVSKSAGNRNRKVLLAPFMLTAGDHAVNDMAGEEESFQSLLRMEGYETTAVLKGLGEYEGIRKLYLEHLKEIMV